MFGFARCALRIGLALSACAAAMAAPPLTAVQDVLYNADSTPFNGIATISWPSFEASDKSNIAASTITTQIVNGLLRLQLVPTANALSPASYTVVYTPASGAQFTQIWIVPSSNVPLPVSSVLIGSPGSVVGGGGAPPADTTSVAISNVTGLQAALNVRPAAGAAYTPSHAAVIDANGLLEGAAGNASDCVHVDGSSGACSASGGSNAALTFVDGEIPQGAMNGSNTVFALANPPQPAASLMLFRNGLLQRQAGDYSISGSTVTFAASAVPMATDSLLASYRLNTGIAGVSFVDQEIPSGAVNGGNVAFTLANAPAPVSSLAVYRNGLRMRQNLDYTVAGTTITFIAAQTPQPGDVIVCSYRM